MVQARPGVAAKLARAADAKALPLDSFNADCLARRPLGAPRLPVTTSTLHCAMAPAPPSVGVEAKLAGLRERVRNREAAARDAAAHGVGDN